MLPTIKRCIQELPETEFSDFYQDYIMESELRVRSHRVKLDLHRFTSVDDIHIILNGLNKMTEELKQL